MTATFILFGSAFAVPYLIRAGLKLFKVDVPKDVYGFEDMDWE